jgi:alpha-1,2-mannosyltransferase
MRLTLRELRGQLVILTVVLWGLAGINMATTTWRLRSGQVKGTDFVHFYTLARLGAEGHADRFADQELQRRIQVAARPESSGVWFPAAYGPQIALLLAPLGHLTYGTALLLWTGLTAAVYLLAMRVVIRAGTIVRQHFSLAMLGAISFPPFWSLVQHGQLSILALGFFLAAWLGLRRGCDLCAGAALGLLAYKPSLAVPVYCVLLCACEWRILIAAFLSASGQVAIILWWVGLGGLRTYGDLLLSSPRLASLLTARPNQMHSWRSFWSLLVAETYLSAALYALSAVATIILAAWLWRKLSDPNLRMAVVTLATVLASPHLYSYDLVVLAPSWIWLTDWYLTRTDLPAVVGRTIYLGYLSPLLSVVALAVHVQLSTVCFATLLTWLWRFQLTTRPADAFAHPGSGTGLC